MLSENVIQNVLNSIKRGADAEYFFKNINKPIWIVPLRDEGLFSAPAKIRTKGDYLQHPNWPQSQYLVRMAEQDPDTVTETILKIPETANERIHMDYVSAALFMDSNNAGKIARKEIDWIKSKEQFSFLYPSYIGKLISHLSNNSKNICAEDLAKSLLQCTKEEREVGTPGDDNYYKTIDIVPKFSRWDYEQVLKKNIPDLVNASGMYAFDMLCDLLETAIHHELNSDVFDDYSWMWRATIEDNEQNISGRDEVKSILVTSIRDAGLQLIKLDSEKFTEVVEHLEAKHYLIFHRISLYIHSQYINDGQAESVANRLTNRDLFEDITFCHEYAQLAKTGFGLLSTKQQNIIFSWIQSGPDLESYNKRVQDHTGKNATNEEIRQYTSTWQRDRLEQFKEHFTHDKQQYYQELINEFGEPDHPDFAIHTTSFIGPISPISKEELQQMSVEEVISFVKGWVPAQGYMEMSPEGLGQILSSVISDNPIEFSQKSHLFKVLDPTYVRSFVDGLRNVPKERGDIPWAEVIDLSLWVVSQEREIQGRDSEYSDIDPGWVWTRKSIANLLENGLKKVKGEIPIELRLSVWDVLVPLTEDPDPFNEEYGEGHMDPSTRSINTVRGEALHTVIAYALWIIRSENAEHSSTFELMPEVQKVLDRHLDLNIDPSLAIRSVYGQWFPWLEMMDEEWARQAKDKIFPLELSEYWESAWKTYVIFCKPYKKIFTLLKDQYAFAVKNIGKPSRLKMDIADSDRRLTEHLMTYYWSGELSIDDELMTEFYTYSSISIKQYAIEFFGRSLRSISEELDPVIRERLEVFWERRYQEALQQNSLTELTEFCWWFSSGKMNIDWALVELKKVLSLEIKLDDLNFVAEELVNWMPERAADVLFCLEQMIEHLKKEGVYFHWEDEAKEILRLAMNDQDEAIIEQAISIIHGLGAMGYFEYKTLLEQK